MNGGDETSSISSAGSVSQPVDCVMGCGFFGALGCNAAATQPQPRVQHAHLALCPATACNQPLTQALTSRWVVEDALVGDRGRAPGPLSPVHLRLLCVVPVGLRALTQILANRSQGGPRLPTCARNALRTAKPRKQGSVSAWQGWDRHLRRRQSRRASAHPAHPAHPCKGGRQQQQRDPARPPRLRKRRARTAVLFAGRKWASLASRAGA
jgi:hypothetical protein